MFMFDLAREKGWSVRELNERMDANELAEWQAYHRIKPLYDFYWMAALISCTMANAMGAKPARKLDDFLPRYARKKTRTPEEALAAFDRAFKLQQG